MSVLILCWHVSLMFLLLFEMLKGEFSIVMARQASNSARQKTLNRKEMIGNGP